MKFKDLNREQIEQLKQRYYCDRNENVSYEELADINELVTDKEVEEEFGDIFFTEEDFCG